MMMTVAEIMTRDVVTIRGLATVSEAVKLMQHKAVKALIVDKRHPHDAYGLVTESDIIDKIAAYGIDPSAWRVYQIMTKPCISVTPDLAVEYAARLFAQARIRCAPVIGDRLEGIISASDIFNKSDFINNPKEYFFESELARSVAHARQICDEKGHQSEDCKVAWRIVEELQAEFAHQRAKILPQTALEAYLEEFPEASTSLLDNWCSG